MTPKGGRPVEFTPATERLFLQTIGTGCSLKDACRVVGVSFDALQRRREADPGFEGRISGVRSDVKVGMLAKIAEAARKGDWRAAQAWLELVYPEEFSRRRLELSGPGGRELAPAPTINISAVLAANPEALDAYHAALTRLADASTAAAYPAASAPPRPGALPPPSERGPA